MNQRIATLLNRYRRVLESANGSTIDDEIVRNYNTLRLADAALDKLALQQAHPSLPPHLVILGPTQAGKSTLCNLVLDADIAGISPLAGYTVHAQGFAVGCSDSELAPVDTLMQPLQRVDYGQLDHDNLEQFVLEPVQAGTQTMISKAVVWDSPDFDSIESGGYRGAVLQAAAVADALILMVSKDKYADKTVWDMLSLVSPLNKPLLVCINKLEDDNRNTVLASFRERYQTRFGADVPKLVTLPFVRKPDNIAPGGGTMQLQDARRQELHAAIGELVNNIDNQSAAENTDAFIALHWPEWVAPIVREQAALANWQARVAAVVSDAQAQYAERYLDNPQKYNSFNRAIAELLTLLEIPGIAGGLSATRKIVTWPVRKLFGIGKQAVSGTAVPADQELEVLELTVDKALTSLQAEVMQVLSEQDAQTQWWQSVSGTLANARNDLESDFMHRAAELQDEFEPQIEAAARQLYAQLQEQPALLNTLRAARVSTDAAAVVLAVKSGGLAAADLLIAPAMLSITTLLTESVLGQYMERSKRQLKQQQQDLFEQQLFNAALSEPLLALGRASRAGSLLEGDEQFDISAPGQG